MSQSSDRGAVLPSYDPDSLCPKCGGGDVATGYEKNAHCSRYPAPCAYGESFMDPDCCNSAKSEHMHRVCRRCQFRWSEAVLTKEATASGR